LLRTELEKSGYKNAVKALEKIKKDKRCVGNI